MRTDYSWRVIIVDDHPAICRDAELLLQSMDHWEVVGTCGSVKEALELIALRSPDLLLLDINLPDGTGFDILERFPERDFKVIFLTAYEEYARQAIRVGAIDYLLKPLNEIEFKSALFKAMGTPEVALRKSPIASSQFQHVLLSSQHHLKVVQLKDIIYCESNSGYTTFYLTDKKKILTSKYLKEYEKYFSPEQFIRTHQSFIVNVNFIEHYDVEGHLLLKDGSKVPVSNRRKEFVLNSLGRLCGG